jgi:hypothetical protein
LQSLLGLVTLVFFFLGTITLIIFPGATHVGSVCPSTHF